MTKIGILTLYHDNHNYGGLLQSYALCKVLNDLGYDARQISYVLSSGYPEYNTSKARIKRALRPVSEISKYLIYGGWYKAYTERCRNLLDFEHSIPHTEEVTAQNIIKLNSYFDTFVCGSDQIWNPIGWQDTLFLSFVKPGKKKIAYSASMARDSFAKEDAEYALRMMHGFTAISLREEQSIKALRQWDSGFNAEVMPDPTMLLNRDQWSAIESDRKPCNHYIFAYFLGKDLSQREQAIQYAKEHGVKIFFINGLDKENRNWEKANKEYMLDHVSVPDFLSLINKADLVITDSFHGAVFSSIFQTNFIVMNRFQSGDKESMNSRIEALMRILGINRIVSELDIYDNKKNFPLSEIEKKNINSALIKQRQKGIEFLGKYIQ